MGDDGIGAYICHCIDREKPAHVQTLTVQQLNTDLLEEFIQYKEIILVDASIQHEEVSFYKVNTKKTSAVSSSHHVDAALLVSLAKKLYNKEIRLMLCAVKAEDFSIKEDLSVIGKENADIAVKILLDYISQH